MEALAVSPALLRPSALRCIAVFSASPSLAFSSRRAVVSRLRPSSVACSAFSFPNGTTAEVEEIINKAVPLYRTIFWDHMAPILAYICLVKEEDSEAQSFLFESVEQSSKGSTLGRCSVVGTQPAMEIVAKEHVIEDPMQVPRKIMEGWTPQSINELPDAFCSGWIGGFSYDTMQYMERKKLPFSASPQDDRNLPDIHLGLYNDIIVFDHVEKKVELSSLMELTERSDEICKDIWQALASSSRIS